MTFFRHPSRDLPRYCDGELSTEQTQIIESHLDACERCRRECDEIRFAASLLRSVPTVVAPNQVWQGIADQLTATTPPVRFVPHWQLQLAGVALLVLAAAVVWTVFAPARGPWQVAEGTGRPTHKAVGDWVETSASSTAKITVGSIGTVNVDPNTRVRLGVVKADQYRLALAHGTISARVTAPPRLFIVDTPASTVVDLGCAYSATINPQGDGTIRVTDGWISLEWNSLESLVPAGASAEINGEIGPGSPVFDDASPGFKRMVRMLEFEGGGNTALDSVLMQARVRDTLTLWHLLRRVDPVGRQWVYARIAEFVPPPAGVTRDNILALDSNALRRWREELAWKW